MPRRPPRAGQPRPSGGRRYPRTHRTNAATKIAAIGHCQWPTGCQFDDAGTPTNPLTLDHPIPRSRGGDHGQPDELVLCRRHNSMKGNR